MSRRIEQISVLLQREIGAVLLREVELPPGAFVTITRVVTTGDLLTATVFVSLFPKEQQGTLLALLKKREGYLRSLLSQRLTMQHIPRFSFVIDEEAARAEDIEGILDSLKAER